MCHRTVSISAPDESRSQPAENPIPLAPTFRWALGLGFAAACLIVGLVSLAGWHKGSVVGLFFEGCDPFCYSEMAASVREGRQTGKPIDYFLQDDQTEFLLDKFKKSGLPEAEWRQAVAPHGYHYFPVSGQVGPQYPPGAPWALSFFRPLGAIHNLNRVSIILVALAGLALVGWCAGRRLVLSCLVVAMATYTYLAIFTWVDLASFSINATIFPLFVGIILAWTARERTSGFWSALLAFSGGLGVGLAIQDRVASVLLVPPMMLFFLPRRLGLMAFHILGIGLGGIGPLLLHDKLVAGGYLLPTYDTDDTEQSFSCIWTNLIFYIHWWHQNSSVHVLILAVSVMALSVLVKVSRGVSARSWRRWRWDRAGFILAPPAAFLIAAGYFLTHKVKEGYYLTPSMLTVALTLALLFVSLEIEWRAVNPQAARRTFLPWTAMGLALFGLMAVYFANEQDFKEGLGDLWTPKLEEAVDFRLPTEMLQKNTWIWADMFSGTVRLETGHPAFKIYAGSTKVRELAFNWVKARGESQYVIEDSETMKRMLDECHSLGWETTLIGYVRDAPCYRMSNSP